MGSYKQFDVKEIEPGGDVDTDDELLDYIRSNADTAFHFCGSARMGSDDMAVVDSQLRVRGVDKLRVIDASVMPTITSGNINPAVLMIGEKGADLLKGRTPPAQAALVAGRRDGAHDGLVPSRLRDVTSDIATVVDAVRS